MKIRYSYNTWLHLLILILISSCIDPYSIPVSREEVNLLVVDGYLNSSANSALVKLSRAIPLSESNAYPVEQKALVSIHDESGMQFDLTEITPGNYSISGMNVSYSKKYMLAIETSDGNKYASDYIELKAAPIIDSVVWKPNPGGISIHVNSHDPTGNTRFYQWQYKEVWEYNADYPSSYVLIDGTIYPRPPADNIFTCWNTEASSKILIQSTSKLSQDVISDFQLTSIEKGSKKISRTYSILVQQKALTPEAYSFYQQLQKTNESLGGLFDPLPSEVTGNVHSTTQSNTPILGYFSGGTIQEKRIFINFYGLPDYLQFTPRFDCVIDSIPLRNIGNYPNSTLIINGYGRIFLEGYLSTSSKCIDCRDAGGTTTKPDFWP